MPLELSEEQEKIVYYEPEPSMMRTLGIKLKLKRDAHTGYVLNVTACPGSGKTFCIVERIVFLVVSQGVPLHQILVLAFNHDAAERIKDSLFKRHPSWRGEIYIGTFHSIGKRLLVEYGMWKKEPFHVDESQYRWCEWLRMVMPFQLFQHVLVDESQDVNQIQYEIICLLLQSCVCLTLVGDPDQNIYSFRGSDSRFMNEIMLHVPAEKRVKKQLTINFRSTWQIIRLANAILQVLHQLKHELKHDRNELKQEEQDIQEEEVRCHDQDHKAPEEEELIQMVACQEEEEEDAIPFHKVSVSLDPMMKGICSRIKSIETSFRSDICILSRNNFLLQKFSEMCQKEKIMFRFCQPTTHESTSYLLSLTQQEKEEKLRQEQDQIVLSTIFCAKGGEWKYVFLIGLHNLHFPDRRSDLLSEWRLFYVAVTRSQYYLELHNNAFFPSDFITFLDPDLFFHDPLNKSIMEYAKARTSGLESTHFQTYPSSTKIQDRKSKSLTTTRPQTSIQRWTSQQNHHAHAAPEAHSDQRHEPEMTRAPRPFLQTSLQTPFLILEKLRLLNGADYLFLKRNYLPCLKGFVNKNTIKRLQSAFPLLGISTRFQQTLGNDLQRFLLLVARRILHEMASSITLFTDQMTATFLLNHKRSSWLDKKVLVPLVQTAYQRCQDPSISWIHICNDLFHLVQCASFLHPQPRANLVHLMTQGKLEKLQDLSQDFILQDMIPYFQYFSSQLTSQLPAGAGIVDAGSTGGTASRPKLDLDVPVHGLIQDRIPLLSMPWAESPCKTQGTKPSAQGFALFLVTGKEYRCSLEEFIRIVYLVASFPTLTITCPNILIHNIETLQLSYLDLTQWVNRECFHIYLSHLLRVTYLS